jgi:GntR family transcriptional regulator
MNRRFSETLQLDPRSGLPIYIQIIEQVKGQIAAETLKPGDQLPTVRALAQELRINFNTVARAYRMLDESGVISTQQGRGTYIMEKAPPESLERLRHESLTALARRYLHEAKRLGFPPEEVQAALMRQLELQDTDTDQGE